MSNDVLVGRHDLKITYLTFMKFIFVPFLIIAFNLLNNYNLFSNSSIHINSSNYLRTFEDSSNLTLKEAKFLDSAYLDKRKDFSFMNKKVGFLLNYIKIDKYKYFDTWGDINFNKSLIFLTLKEKTKFGGYDVIVTLKKKEGLIKQIANRHSILKKYKNQ